MRRLLRFAAKLYPPWWRKRYGVEFNDLLEDSKPGWYDVPDIVKGAIEMRMSISTRAGIAVACGVTGAALAFGASFLMQPKYESSAVLVLAWPGDHQYDLANVGSRVALASIIEKDGLYQRERSGQSMDAAVDKMKGAIRINPLAPNVFKVSFTYENPAAAQAAIMDFSNQFLTKFPVKSLASPGLMRNPVSPARMNMAIFGLGAGLLLALILLVILPTPQHPGPTPA